MSVTGIDAGGSALDSVEQGLRDLAKGQGPSLSKLVEPDTDGLRSLMDLTAPMAREGMPVDSRARALLQYIRQVIAGFNDPQHPKCKAALQAAFCLTSAVSDGENFPSINERLAIIAREGAFGENAGLKRAQASWEQGVPRLARLVLENIDELRLSAGWASGGAPSGYQPLRVVNLTVTYLLTGQTVTDVVTERRIVAVEDGIDRYIVRDYVQGAPDAQIEVRPLLNCRAGEHTPINLGPGFVALKAEMLLPSAYPKGAGCNFATQVKRMGVTGATTWQEIQVTSHGVESLTMRVQFDATAALPSRCWYFAEMLDLDRLEVPDRSEGRDLEVSRFGYAERIFGRGQPTAKYGLVWQW